MKVINLIQALSIWVVIFISFQGLAKSTHLLSQNPQVESIFKYTIDKNGISFKVYTGGCTCKKSFDFIKNTSTDGKDTHLTLVRVFPDHCKANVPGGTIVWFSFEELGVNPESILHIENPSAPDRP